MRPLFEDNQVLDALSTAAENDNHKRRTLTVDIERYKHLLDSDDLTEDQKEELLQALWSIIIAFVDLGFGVHPVQQVQGQKACGQVSKSQSDIANATTPEGKLEILED